MSIPDNDVAGNNGLDVHPVADLFPMLATDELDELAADIKERGLLQPIVLDVDGRVLDGRNRLAACARAGVEPTFTCYEGDDPDGYALSVNIARRHLTTGARAIVAAQAARLIGTSYKSVTDTEAKLNKVRISEAVLVLDYAPDLAASVLSGDRPLSVVLETARERKRDADALAAKTERLRQNAPDLHALVGEERMTIDDATAALEAREEKARAEKDQRAREAEERAAEREEAAERFTRSVAQALGVIWSQLEPDPGAAIKRSWRKQHNTWRSLPGQAERFTADGLRHTGDLLTKLATYLDENEGTL